MIPKTRYQILFLGIFSLCSLLAESPPKTLRPKAIKNQFEEDIPILTPRKRTPSPEGSTGDGDNFFILGLNLLNMNYKEDLPPPSSKENGVLVGANVGLVSHAIQSILLKVNGDVYFGRTRYDGALQDIENGTTVPHQSTTNILILDGEMGAGYLLYDDKITQFAPYVGFGIHFWNRGLTGEGSYTEHYLFTYIPVGVRLEKKFSEEFFASIDAAYHFNLGGTISISDLEGFNNSAGTLGRADGVKIKIPLNYKISSHTAIHLTPFFEHFKIGKGDDFDLFPTDGGAPSSFHEPASDSYFFGGHLGLTVIF